MQINTKYKKKTTISLFILILFKELIGHLTVSELSLLRKSFLFFKGHFEGTLKAFRGAVHLRRTCACALPQVARAV